jgi:hypothetical protein
LTSLKNCAKVNTEMTDEQGKIIVTLESTEKHYDYEQLSLTFDSTDEEILDAIAPVILEQDGINIKEDDENLYTVKRIEDSGNIYVFPKSVAGTVL